MWEVLLPLEVMISSVTETSGVFFFFRSCVTPRNLVNGDECRNKCKEHDRTIAFAQKNKMFSPAVVSKTFQSSHLHKHCGVAGGGEHKHPRHERS